MGWSWIHGKLYRLLKAGKGNDDDGSDHFDNLGEVGDTYANSRVSSILMERGVAADFAI